MGGHRPYITDHLGLRLVVVSHYTMMDRVQLLGRNYHFLYNLYIEFIFEHFEKFYYVVIPDCATRGFAAVLPIIGNVLFL